MDIVMRKVSGVIAAISAGLLSPVFAMEPPRLVGSPAKRGLSDPGFCGGN